MVKHSCVHSCEISKVYNKIEAGLIYFPFYHRMHLPNDARLFSTINMDTQYVYIHIYGTHG